MPQFQIRRHPHGGTWQLFDPRQKYGMSVAWQEHNTVQALIDFLEIWFLKNADKTKFQIEVFSN